MLEFITSKCGGIMVEVHYIKPMYLYIVMSKILFLTAALKNIDVAVGGVCNEYVINGESTTSAGYQ